VGWVGGTTSFGLSTLFKGVGSVCLHSPPFLPATPSSIDSSRGLIECRLLAHVVNKMVVMANLNFHLPPQHFAAVPFASEHFLDVLKIEVPQFLVNFTAMTLGYFVPSL
jgi:hypothetical protein